MTVSYHIEHYTVLPDSIRSQVYSLLDECDNEFVPPLSHRVSTRQSNLKGASSSSAAGLRSYFDEMTRQSFLLAISNTDGRLLAFLSYIPRRQLPEEILDRESTYVSTICTAHDARSNGIARALYRELEELADTITIRTWSTNESQLHVLNILGYEELAKIPNDRGQGVDSLYFIKKLGEHHERIRASIQKDLRLH